MNAQRLRLTGEARYGDELERFLYNHLAAAQRPDGKEWCYYTALEGTKPYGPGIRCCVSSGPLGMAMAPQFAYLTTRVGGKDTLALNLFDSSRTTLRLGGQTVVADLQAPITLQPSVKSGQAQTAKGWTTLPPRQWKEGDTVRIGFSLKPKIVSIRVIGKPAHGDSPNQACAEIQAFAQ